MRAALLLLVLSSCASVAPATSVGGGPLMSRPPQPTIPAAERVLMRRASLNQVPLFPDELEALRRLAFEFLKSRMVALIPLDELDAVEILAASGRTTPNGPMCAAPTPSWILFKDRYPSVAEASLTADCHAQPCKVQLHLAAPLREGQAQGPGTTWEATVDPPATLASWKQATGRLAPPPPKPPHDHVGGLVGMSTGDDPRRVRIERVYSSGPWAARPSTADLTLLQGALDACHEPGWSSAGEDKAVLSISAAGTVDRCSIDPTRDPARPARVDCLCRTLSSKPFPPGPTDRRLLVYLMNTPRSLVRAGATEIGARFDAVVTRDGTEVRPQLSDGTQPLAHCYAATTPTGLARLRTHLELSGTGQVTAATVDGAAPPLKTCLEQALRATPLPCSKSGAPTSVDATLVLYVLTRP